MVNKFVDLGYVIKDEFVDYMILCVFVFGEFGCGFGFFLVLFLFS